MGRAVVSGLGVVSALGNDADTFFSRLAQGVSGVTEKSISILGETKTILCAATDSNPLEEPLKAFKLAESVLQDALKMSHLLDSYKNGERVGLFIGTATGIIPVLEGERGLICHTNRLKDKSLKPYNGIAEYLTGKLPFKPMFVTTFTSACASSTIALIEAAKMIRKEMLDCVIVIGTEALSSYDFLGFESLGIISKTNIKPFDDDRDGIVLGEGAAAIIIENEESVKKRKIPYLVEIAGGGISNDAYRLATPDPEGTGAAKCMNAALQQSNLSYGAIDYINAHGTGTKLNDRMETKAIKQVFKENSKEIPISSSKSMLGHTRGASGALEGLISILSIVNEFIPPTINYNTPDKECDLDYVPNIGRAAPIQHVMSNSFGFGGHNSSVIFSKV
ncbi:beta-ketoacyl-[acyl-carrier-protein] synthase family protein [Paenibacillus sp. FSL L8-0340]|uniref:beta-ketoacyl-[acyl-carrier-protein] synthase family protein n=1 Tax=Paenibacillus sp. FSL L8-0340 TaxID=2954685 RepID=UPI003158E939